MIKRIITIALVLFVMADTAVAVEKSWRVGVATRKITPTQSMWMAGYAARNKPSEGTEHDLFVKALALEDPGGKRAVLLTSDLIGLPRSVSQAVVEEVGKRLGLKREQLLLTVSHTHCGPVVRDNLADMYPMPPEEARKIAPYAEQLQRWMVEAIVEAVNRLRPARLDIGQGTARFAVNRRNNAEKDVPALRERGQMLQGPFDHDVPVLRVASLEGKLLAVVFGYACHNTTMDYLKWSGDYAGFAQLRLEQKHPGAVAMFWSGCGGDQNPLPRRRLDLCKAYGQQLAEAVEQVLQSPLVPITGTLTLRYAEIGLAYDKLPSAEQLAADLLSKNLAVRNRAAHYKKLLDTGQTISREYAHYPIQIWKLGQAVVWVALGGEVVVDYSLRLKKELAGRHAVWVAGYANDVMAYIPSERVLKEGGYEGETAMVYYGLPSRWATGLEEKIVRKVRELVE